MDFPQPSEAISALEYVMLAQTRRGVLNLKTIDEIRTWL